MKRVLIFTDIDSWDLIDLGEYNAVKEQWNVFYPNDSRPIVKCLFDKHGPAELEEVNDCEQEGVYLVYDEISKSLFNTLMNQCSENDTMLLVHEHGDWTQVKIPQQLKGNCRSGRHENSEPEKFLYNPVFSILADNEGDKFARVIKILNPTEKDQLQNTILAFLMGCMIPYNEDPVFIEAKDKLISNPKCGSMVDNFYENQYPNSTKSGEEPPRSVIDYYEALTSVRDSLMEIIAKL